jgi:hypothetical protein
MKNKKLHGMRFMVQINEEFKKQYPNMNEKDLMRWRFQRYMQDYLGTIAGIDEGVGQGSRLPR